MIAGRWHHADTPILDPHSRAVCEPTPGGLIRMYQDGMGGGS
jgi:hypothetical protein